MTVDNTSTCGDRVGTVVGYNRHSRAREDACPHCKRAWADYIASRRKAAWKKELPEDHHAHGTLSGYTWYGCRCDPCTAANRDNRRTNSARRRAEGLPRNSPLHGTLNGYTGYGCRCAKCRTAQRTYQRQRRQK